MQSFKIIIEKREKVLNLSKQFLSELEEGVYHDRDA